MTYRLITQRSGVQIPPPQPFRINSLRQQQRVSVSLLRPPLATIITNEIHRSIGEGGHL
jgi:hypothetical protein